MGILEILLLLLTVAVLFFVLLCTALFMSRKPYPVIERFDEEKYFEDSKTRLKCPFPSLTDMPSVSLSVIVPAYNEEKRLPPMLDETFEYLERRCRNEGKFSYEIIVVSDGSTDRTSEVVMSYAEKYSSDKIRLLNLTKNRGKGGAVRLGIQSCRGALILFADADGATRFSDLDKLYSRFNSALPVRTVRDTQCGFKLFTRTAARTCFRNLHIERWAFDVELLYIAETINIPLEEVAVYWTEIDGSKVTPVWSWIQMGSDLLLLWLRYRIGAWKLMTKEE